MKSKCTPKLWVKMANWTDFLFYCVTIFDRKTLSHIIDYFPEREHDAIDEICGVNQFGSLIRGWGVRFQRKTEFTYTFWSLVESRMLFILFFYFNFHIIPSDVTLKYVILESVWGKVTIPYSNLWREAASSNWGAN